MMKPEQARIPVDGQDLESRLSRISTIWEDFRKAHGEADEAAQARQELMQRYCGAVYRYLLGALRDPHAAEDLAQEFALRFIRGCFRQADPERGRFRDYVKTALFHLVSDHRRRQGKEGIPLPVGSAEGEPPAPPDDAADRAFNESWRQELLARGWKALAQVEQQTGQPFYEVLRFRVEHPDLTSTAMAEKLGALLSRPLTPANVRQLLHRAREKFADLLLDETRRSLGASGERLEEELADLNLLKYCQDALKRQTLG